MPRVDHRRLEILFTSSKGAVPSLQGDGDGPARRRRNVKIALGLQTVSLKIIATVGHSKYAAATVSSFQQYPAALWYQGVPLQCSIAHLLRDKLNVLKPPRAPPLDKLDCPILPFRASWGSFTTLRHHFRVYWLTH